MSAQAVAERGLQAHAPWMNKCIQLYETYLVRSSSSNIPKPRAFLGGALQQQAWLQGREDSMMQHKLL
jgi:hypothetical protein